MAQNKFFLDAIKCEAMQVKPTPTVKTASLASDIALKTILKPSPPIYFTAGVVDTICRGYYS